MKGKRAYISMRRTAFLIFLFLWLSIIPTALQSQDFDYEYFNTEKGLPDDFIFDFDIDQNGVLWISTRAGISTYDGFNFTSVESIPRAVNYRSIRFDKKGRLWLIKDIYEYSINVTDKITIFDIGTNIVSTIDKIIPNATQTLSPNDNYTLKTDSDDNLSIIANKPAPVLYLENDSLIEYITHYPITKFTLGLEQPFSILSINRTLDSTSIENIKTHEVRKYSTSKLLSVVEKNNELIIKGSLYHFDQFGNNNSVITAEGMDSIFIPGFPQFKHTSIGDKTIIAALDKLIVYDSEKKTSYSLSDQLGGKLKNSTVLRIKVKNEVIWIGTSNGLFKITQKNSLFSTRLNGNQLSIRNIIQKNNHEFIICTERGIYEIDIFTGSEKVLVKDAPAFTLTQLDRDNFIVGSHSALTQKWNIDQDTLIRSLSKISEPFNSYSGVHIFYLKDINESIWSITSNGLSKYFTEQDSISVIQSKWKNISRFYNIYQNPIDSSKLFLSNREGVYEFDINTEYLNKIDALTDVIPVTITKDKADENTIWIGTKYKGLIKWIYNDSIITAQYTTSNGLKSNNVHSVLFDRSGNLWMSTDHGISILDVETNTINTLTKVHGLHENEFNKHSALALGDSLFIYGGVDGLIYFDPNKANEISIQNPTEIIGATYTDNKTGKNVIQNFSYDRLNYIKLNNRQLNYKLITSKTQSPLVQTIKYLMVEVNENWKYSQNNTIPIENLGFGENKLLISRQLGVNMWSPPKTITIVKSIPFYKNIWLYVIGTAVLLSLIIMYLGKRSKQAESLNAIIQNQVNKKTIELSSKNSNLEKANELNNDLFQIIGHDLRSPITSLTNITKSFKYLSENGTKEEVIKLGESVDANATKLLDTVDKLIRWSLLKRNSQMELESIDLIELTHDIIDSYKVYINKNGLTIEVLTVLENLNIYSDYGSIRSTLKNIIYNALKFSHSEGTISIIFHQSNSIVTIRIKDNGIGISTNLINNILSSGEESIPPKPNYAGEIGLGLGLKNSIKLLGKLDSKINITQNSPKGTIVDIILQNHLPNNLF